MKMVIAGMVMVMIVFVVACGVSGGLDEYD